MCLVGGRVWNYTIILPKQLVNDCVYAMMYMTDH